MKIIHFYNNYLKNNSIWNEWKNFLKNYFENILQVTEKKTLTKERFKNYFRKFNGCATNPRKL